MNFENWNRRFEYLFILQLKGVYPRLYTKVPPKLLFRIMCVGEERREGWVKIPGKYWWRYLWTDPKFWPSPLDEFLVRCPMVKLHDRQPHWACSPTEIRKVGFKIEQFQLKTFQSIRKVEFKNKRFQLKNFSKYE